MPWLTPETLPTETICRQLAIPDNVDIMAAVTGALLDLTRVENWEEFGAVTPDEISSAMVTMIMNFWEGCTPAVLAPTFVMDKKTQNTAGGTTTLGSWQVRDLNFLTGDLFNGITLASNRFTLPAGRWLIRANAPAYACGRHQIRLIDYPTGAQYAVGTSEQNGASADAQTRSFLLWTALINSPVTFQIVHRTSGTKATNGFGVPANLSDEIYTIVEIQPLPA